MKSPTLWSFISVLVLIGSIIGLCVLDFPGMFIPLLIVGFSGLVIFTRAAWQDIDRMAGRKPPKQFNEDFE